METLSLRPANYEDLEEEWLFVQAMPEDENGLTNRWHAISREEFEKTALPDMIRYAKGIGLPDWMVPETFYFLWKDEKNHRAIQNQALFERFAPGRRRSHRPVHRKRIPR